MKLTGAWPGPTTAWAVPLPAFEPDGQAALPWVLSVSAVQYLKPLPLSLTCLPRLTVMVSTVASVLLFLTNSLSVEFLGFFFVPALVGETFAVTSVGAGVLGHGDSSDGDGKHGGERHDQVLAQRLLLRR